MADAAMKMIEAQERSQAQRWADHEQMHDREQAAIERRLGGLAKRVEEHDMLFEEWIKTQHQIRGGVKAIAWLIGVPAAVLGLIATVRELAQIFH